MVLEYNPTKPASPTQSLSVSRMLDVSTWSDCVLEPCYGEPPCCPIYSIPFIGTDVFCFEYNRTPVNVHVYENSTNILYGSFPAFITGKKVCIDFSLLELDCLYIVIEFSGESFCCADFFFERVSESLCNEETCLLESFYPESDCHGHMYPAYSNRIRWWSKLEHVSVTSNATTSEDPDGNILTSKETLRRVFAYRTMKAIPSNSWILYHLSEVVLRGFDLTINGIIFEKYNGEISKNFEKDAWNIQVELTEKLCKLDYNC